MGQAKNIRTFVLLTLLTTQVYARENVNQLNWVKTTHNKLSTQIMLDFSEHIFFEQEIDKEKHLLIFTFPGMTLQTFDPKQITTQCTKLQKLGLLKKVEITQINKPAQKIVLSFEFEAYRTAVNPQTKTKEKKKNAFLIKWSTLDNPYRLIVDIFLKEDLDTIIKKDAILLHAQNDSLQFDFSVTPTQTKQVATSNQKRIIIDPGHGGSDAGTIGYFGLREKEIALDIAKRVNRNLKKSGYKSILTRSTDKKISLAHRAEFAGQLKADLFVSIHLNSAGKLNDRASGIETFYFDGRNLLRHNGRTGFLFVNFKKDAELIKRLNNKIQSTLQQSKALAQSIHENIIKALKAKNIPIKNRGIKPEKFRIFLQSGIPTALAEVGFLTNRTDAKNLSKQSHREIVAQGICAGIQNFLATNN